MASVKVDSTKPSGTYVSHTTVLLILGQCTFHEYMTNKFKENISPELMNKKYYIDDKLALLDSQYEKLLTQLKLVKTLKKAVKRTEKEMVLQSTESNDVVSSTTSCTKKASTHNQKKISSTLSQKVTSGRKTPSLREVSSSSVVSQRPATPSLSHMRRRSSLSPNHNSKVAPVPVNNPVKRPSTPFVEAQKPKKAYDAQLPDELLMCGECSMTMSSIQHLDRHLERCRGNKRRNSTEAPEVPPTKRIFTK